MKRFRLWIPALLAAALLWPVSTAFGQGIRGCLGITEIEGSKIVLSRVDYQLANGSTVSLTKTFPAEYQITLLEKMKNLFGPDEVKHVFCYDRSPSIDGADYTDDYVESLNAEKVLVEMWGLVKESRNGSKVTANFYVMIIPINVYDKTSSDVYFHILTFPLEPGNDQEEALVRMALGTEFTVYTYMAQGITEFENENLDMAKKYITKARLMWERALKDNSLANMAPDPQRVMDYLSNFESQIIEVADTSKTYKGTQVEVHNILVDRGR